MVAKKNVLRPGDGCPGSPLAGGSGLCFAALVNISRYQHRIANAIGRSIGRPVHISSVKLRLLPLPGFEFSGFSVEEDPHFGSEPILHSASVVAYLRLLSLWRGRLESPAFISTMQFESGRDPNGAWTWARFWSRLRKSQTPPPASVMPAALRVSLTFEAENARIISNTERESRFPS